MPDLAAPLLLQTIPQALEPLLRVTILHTPPIADIDGIQLDCFEVGHQYELGNSLAALFLAEGWAEPVPLDDPRPHTPFSDNDPFETRIVRNDLARENHPPYLDRHTAADFKSRRRPRRRGGR